MFSLDSSQTSGQSRNKFFFVKKFLRHSLTAANKQCCCTTIVEQTWANEKLRNKIHETNQRVTVSHCKKTLPIFQSELFYQFHVWCSGVNIFSLLKHMYFNQGLMIKCKEELISHSIEKICCLLPRISTTGEHFMVWNVSYFTGLYFRVSFLS